MNSEIKTRWVTALRSGDFQQGGASLAIQVDQDVPMTHCCLGVLCELAVEDGIIDAETHRYATSGKIRRFGDGVNWANAQLPAKVARWAGLVDRYDRAQCDPTLYTVPDFWGSNIPLEVTCSKANDGHFTSGIQHQSFSEIADRIEENL